jgi:hypothetical protein
MAIVAIILMAIGGYSINRIMAISDYFVVSHWWLFY